MIDLSLARNANLDCIIPQGRKDSFKSRDNKEGIKNRDIEELWRYCVALILNEIWMNSPLLSEMSNLLQISQVAIMGFLSKKTM